MKRNSIGDHFYSYEILITIFFLPFPSFSKLAFPRRKFKIKLLSLDWILRFGAFYSLRAQPLKSSTSIRLTFLRINLFTDSVWSFSFSWNSIFDFWGFSSRRKRQREREREKKKEEQFDSGVRRREQAMYPFNLKKNSHECEFSFLLVLTRYTVEYSLTCRQSEREVG